VQGRDQWRELKRCHVANTKEEQASQMPGPLVTADARSAVTAKKARSAVVTDAVPAPAAGQGAEMSAGRSTARLQGAPIQSRLSPGPTGSPATIPAREKGRSEAAGATLQPRSRQGVHLC
jgi:hypothetical protein